jgi:nucleoside-triphosphatase
MASNVLITGAPGSGKTSVIKHLLHDLTPLVIRGFYKEEIYENQTCKGYRILTFDYREHILAHVHYEGPDRIGPFGVNIEGFEKFILPEFNSSIPTELYIIDEIGRMECLSLVFCDKLTVLLDSPIPLIATVDPIIFDRFKNLRHREDTSIVWITRKNKANLWKEVILKLS